MSFKSCFDKSVALSATLVLSPLLAIIAVAIKLEDGGPVFFKQERIGKRGEPFICFKFRTMREGAEELLQKWEKEQHPNWRKYVDSNFKLKQDPRVTRIGALLRVTSFDELAQLINIIRGEMSLVGPRPLLGREIEAYGSTRFDCYCQMVPGLTGLWQVSGRSDTTFDMRAKLDMDYYDKKSFKLDLTLMVKTFKVLFRKSGAY